MAVACISGVYCRLLPVILLSYTVMTVESSRCSVYGDVQVWREDSHPAEIVVRWTYGEGICRSIHTCYKTTLGPDDLLRPQLIPISIQKGYRVHLVLAMSVSAVI
ncbi:Hypothetical predicted protein [Octopus vulgaris]|uniref:Uncharacterized protein n=1 Tax=Octopus vulgaris TaxID=6645 RepID=A0AA36BMF2_OCTVU|nr:Hypothetical predicted protein [Octopus vulgaris]